MKDNVEQSLQSAIINNFDEENDIIIPTNWYSELVYIKCILKDIFKKRNITYAKQEFAKLKRQILLWHKYKKK